MEVPRLEKLIGNLKLCEIRVKARLREPAKRIIFSNDTAPSIQIPRYRLEASSLIFTV